MSAAKNEARKRPPVILGDFLDDGTARDVDLCPVCRYYGIRRPVDSLARYGREKRMVTIGGQLVDERTVCVCGACRNRYLLRRWTEPDGKRRVWLGWDSTLPTD